MTDKQFLSADGLAVTGTVTASGKITGSANIRSVASATDGTDGFEIFDNASGGTHIGSATREGNGLNLAGYDNVYLTAGATTIGGGSIIGTISSTGLAVTGTVTASTGVLFGTDTAAANTLDDYEEGAWTPAYASSGTASTFSYGLQIGSYVKIGRLVSCTLRIYTNTSGNTLGTGDITITGLPYACTSGVSQQTTAINMVPINGGWVTVSPIAGTIADTSTAISLKGIATLNASPTDLTVSNMDAAGNNQVWATFQYYTTA